MGRKRSFQETANWKEHDFWKQYRKKMLVSDRCPNCGFIPVVKKRRLNGKEYWEYECNCSKAVIEAKVWERKVDAFAKLADIWWGYDGLLILKKELDENDDIVAIYETALGAMTE